MALTNPLRITYGTFDCGGSSNTYQLTGAYVIDKTFNAIRLQFDVLVVTASSDALQTACASLETEMRKRDKNLVIYVGTANWTYTSGSTLFNVYGSATKSGDPTYDRGSSRLYTCVVSGELSADDRQGLRDVKVSVGLGSNRQMVVDMQGVYTATTSTAAVAQYLARFDTEATTLLTAVGSGRTFELVDESYERDRNDAICSFSRQYKQIIYSQGATLDVPEVVDHRISFSDTSSLPGDSRQGIYRLRRVVCSFDCTLRIDSGNPPSGAQPDPRTIYNTKVRDFVQQRFAAMFQPQAFAIDGEQLGFDMAASRLSATVQFLYQPTGAARVVEINESVTVREGRQIDYTPVHNQSEFSYYADAGWAVRERVWNRTVVVIGNDMPKYRIGQQAQAGDAGLMDERVVGIMGVDARNTGGVQRSGWNVVSNVSKAEKKWIGDPSGQRQIEHTMLVEEVVERWHQVPSDITTSGGSGGLPGPVTQGGS